LSSVEAGRYICYGISDFLTTIKAGSGKQLWQAYLVAIKLNLRRKTLKHTYFSRTWSCSYFPLKYTQN